jgi:hypothetical protein
MMKTLIAALVLSAAATTANAQIVTHTGDMISSMGVATTPAFGVLAEAVGTQAINYGVDYSYGNVEGLFIDPPFALCGINSSNVCDLVTNVDGRIVQLGTTSQGVTSYLQILAGSAAPGALTLSAFDINGLLLETAVGAGSTGPFTISRATADIAFFSIGGSDTFGVQSVSLETPILSGAVPEPATWAMMIGGFGMVGGAMRRRRVSAKVSFA